MISEQIVMVLSTLTPKEREVIALRFGIRKERTSTIEEIGRFFPSRVKGSGREKQRH